MVFCSLTDQGTGAPGFAVMAPISGMTNTGPNAAIAPMMWSVSRKFFSGMSRLLHVALTPRAIVLPVRALSREARLAQPLAIS
jgi:hypothetical protein